MALEAIISVTLGLLIIWIILSVASNLIQDWIGLRLDKSARDVYHAVAGMIQDAELTNKFYSHSVILGLTLGRKKLPTEPKWFHKYPILRGIAQEESTIPSFIPSAVFADAMFDVFVYESLTHEEAREELSVARIQTSIERLKESKPQLSQILSKLFPRLDKPSILDIKIAECKANIENWYNYSTAYLTEAQRRYEQTMALLIGFVIALLLNIDMISIATQLWREPTIRQVIVQSASNFELAQEDIQTNPVESLENFRAQFEGLNLPIGWGIFRGESSSIADANCRLFPAEDQAFGIRFIGSNNCIVPPEPNSQTNILLKLFGFFVTAIAARQGAPFWSEILKRLVSRVH